MQANKTKKNLSELEVIGVMSGTSLDGLDLAWCRFDADDLSHFQLLTTKTLPYPDALQRKLSEAVRISAEELFALDVELGQWFGKELVDFIGKGPAPDAIASHGHTIFHQPERGFTVQIGNPAHIKAATSLPIISDFRSLDVALGGQGAPLVPVGDMLLFADYDYCLNLGGIANISYSSTKHQRIAYDVTFCNMVLNHLAGRLGKDYDEDGDIARSGKIVEKLQKALNEWSYYDQQGPRSLGFEQVSADILPLLDNAHISDMLHTCVTHIAQRISKCCTKPGRMLITGGGAHNGFLRERLQQTLSHVEVVYPEPWLVDYKEAIVFALLGALRIWGKENILSSVTGAREDSISGQYL